MRNLFKLKNQESQPHAAREGARVGVVYNKPQRIQQQEINAAVKKYIENNLISFSSTGDSLKPLVVETTNEEGDFVTGICPQGIRPGTKLKVTVKFDYSFLLLPNFIATFFSGNMSETISLTSEAIMICE
jgi:hypothetical protein